MRLFSSYSWELAQARIQGGCFGGYSNPGMNRKKKKKKEKKRKEREKEKERKKDLLQSCYATLAVIKLLTPSDTGTERGWGRSV